MPEEYEDYSDDEKEARKRSGVRSGTRKRNSLERHKKFEHKMNKRNTMDSMSHTAQHGNLPKPTDFQVLMSCCFISCYDWIALRQLFADKNMFQCFIAFLSVTDSITVRIFIIDNF